MTERSPHAEASGSAAGLSVTARIRLLESGEQTAGFGTWEWWVDAGTVRWSANLYRIYRLDPEQTEPCHELVLDLIHPDDRHRVAGYLDTLRNVTAAPPIGYRIRPPGGGIRYVRCTISTIEIGPRGARRIVGAVLDVTDQHLAAQEIAAHIAVSKALADWDDLEHGGARLLQSLAGAMEFALGALWLPQGDRLTARLVWSDPSLDAGEFEAATFALRVAPGQGVPGLAWQDQTTVNVVDVRGEPSLRRPAQAAAADLRGAVGVPVIHAGEVLAVLEFYYREEFRATPRMRQTMSAIGLELGEFLSHRLALLRRPPLTRRELQVLGLVANGYSGPQIAGRLEISVATVGSHMKNIYERLGVSDRAAAVANGLRSGLIK